MSTKTMQSTNALIDSYAELAEFLASPNGLGSLSRLTVNWVARQISDIDAKFESILTLNGYITGERQPFDLTERGVSLLGKLLVDLRSISIIGRPVGGKYEVEALISHGKNSATFRVRHIILKRLFVLKVIRPGSGLHLESALVELSKLNDTPHLIFPIDYFTFEVEALQGSSVALQCIVFPYVEAKTLKEFLNDNPPLTPYFISSLIEQLAVPLAALEAIGAYHGDLHAENILVRQPSQGNVTFYLIDISYGIGTPSEFKGIETDFGNFQGHLWRSLETLQRRLSGMSLQKHLGARIYALVKYILEAKACSFRDIVHLLRTNRLYEEFCAERDKFISEKFASPSGLHLLRYEEFTKPEVAIELFEPFTQLLNTISQFGNALLYGHRGSGKSTYLAALASFPEVDSPTFDIRKKFGVFFACRQGEFKQYSSDLVAFSPEANLNFKHILVLKIIRRLVAALVVAERCSRIRRPASYDRLYCFFEDNITSGELGAYDSSIVSPVENLHAGLLRNEIIEIDAFFGRIRAGRKQPRFLTEENLIEFCALVKQVYVDLSETRFFLLFDDAGVPNVPVEAQRVLNEIVRATNSVYCVKLSAERYSYIFEDTNGKALEETHDIAVHDISKTLFLGSGKSPQRREVEKYFRKIMTRRLQHWHYRSFDITDYLGEELIPLDELVGRLSQGRRDAYYAGWEVVWQLADRTVRNLLETVNQIFAIQDIQPQSEVSIVPAHSQDAAVRSTSDRKLRALSYIPGTIRVFNDETPLGRKLYEFTAAFGSMAQAYLKHASRSQKAGKGERFDERIAIERNDYQELSPPAKNFLEALIRFGILDDSQLAHARDDKVKKPLYIMNRIFCPAFAISFRRETHLRLSTGRFEQLLLEPLMFAKEGTRFLRDIASKGITNYALFD